MVNYTEHTVTIRSITEYEVPSYHPNYHNNDTHALAPIKYNENLAVLMTLIQLTIASILIFSTLFILVGIPISISDPTQSNVNILVLAIAAFVATAGYVQPLIVSYFYYENANTHNRMIQYDINDIADAMTSLRHVYFDRDNTVYFGYMFIDVESSTATRLTLKIPKDIKPSSIHDTPSQDAIIENLNASDQYPSVQSMIDTVFDVYYAKQREYDETLTHGNITIQDETSTPFYMAMQRYAEKNLIETRPKAGVKEHVEETHDAKI